jgi:hypothetical protein
MSDNISNILQLYGFSGNEFGYVCYIRKIGVCGKNIQRVKIESEGKIIEQVSNVNCLGR